MIERIARRDRDYPITFDAEGNPLCRWDQKPVAPGRRAYCSRPCQIEVDIRCSASSLREHVGKRDKGVCARCGMDTKRLRRILKIAERCFTEINVEARIVIEYALWPRTIEPYLRRIGFSLRGHLWEADHIVEVVNGGDSGLSNMQTLCLVCHREKTKLFRGELAAAKRALAAQIVA